MNNQDDPVDGSNTNEEQICGSLQHDLEPVPGNDSALPSSVAVRLLRWLELQGLRLVGA